MHEAVQLDSYDLKKLAEIMEQLDETFGSYIKFQSITIFNEGNELGTITYDYDDGIKFTANVREV